MTEERRFPLLGSRGQYSEASIPWAVAEKAYEEYARRFGRSQSLQRLAERGGFGPGEMDMLYPEWRKACKDHRVDGHQ